MNGEEGRRRLSPAQVTLCVAIQLPISRRSSSVTEKHASVLVLLLQPNEGAQDSRGSTVIRQCPHLH